MIKIFNAIYPVQTSNQIRKTIIEELETEVNANLKLRKMEAKHVKWLQTMNKDRIIITAIVG